MLLIVGLGNPGAKYKDTYHNVGFMIVDMLAKKLQIKFTKKECDARTAKGRYKGFDFVLAKPETFMNESGLSVKQLIKHYNLDETSELIVCYDDADLPLGKTRLREEGSAGTHNGMRSIVAQLHTTQFKRLRVGIQNEQLSQKAVNLIDLVLSKIAFDEKNILNNSFDIATDALLDLIEGVDIQRIEERINKKTQQKKA